MSGIRNAGMRPKTSKNLRSGTKKKFRNTDPEAQARYSQKMAARAARKLKKASKRKK